MPYVPKTDWQHDETVTEQDLNRIEGGIKQALDEIGEIEIPQASLEQAGITQLSNATNGTRENVAPTEKALKEAYDRSETLVGNLANLKTSVKSNVVSSINELFLSASDGKTAIASAITAKGVAASPSDTFPTLATKIGQINTGKKYIKISRGSMLSESSYAFSTEFTPGVIYVTGKSSSGSAYPDRIILMIGQVLVSSLPNLPQWSITPVNLQLTPITPSTKDFVLKIVNVAVGNSIYDVTIQAWEL